MARIYSYYSIEKLYRTTVILTGFSTKVYSGLKFAHDSESSLRCGRGCLDFFFWKVTISIFLYRIQIKIRT
jgi:hypothetical protein